MGHRSLGRSQTTCEYYVALEDWYRVAQSIVWCAATGRETLKLTRLGSVIAKSVVSFFSLESNIEIINCLRTAGVQLKISETELTGQTNILESKAFVVSGIFMTVTRNQLKLLIEKNGGRVVSSISKKTNYVVAGDKMGPSKRVMAENLGITILL